MEINPQTESIGRPIRSVLAGIIILMGLMLMLQTVVGLVFMPILEWLGLPNGLATLTKARLGKPLDTLEVRMLLAIQGIASVSAFVISPFVYQRFFGQEKGFPQLAGAVKAVPLILVTLLSLTFSMVNQALYKLNSLIPLPEGSIGDYFNSQSETVQKLTEQLLSAQDLNTVLISLLVVVAIPAFGEELFFRGVLQKLWVKATGNVHTAIWLNSFLFAAIHMEFNGLLPRLALSAVFGYLFVWYGKLWLPIIAHALNNLWALVAHYSTLAYGFKSSEELNIPYEEYFWLAGFLGSGLIIYKLYVGRSTQTT